MPVHRVDERPQVVRLAERGVRGVVAAHLVAPRGPVRVLHHRQQLDVREPELDHVLDELVGEVTPAEALAPRAGVHLVDRHRGGADRSRRGARASRRAPDVARAVDERRVPAVPRRGTRRVGLEPRDAVRAAHRELVGLPLARVRGDARPHARDPLRGEDVDALAPRVPVPDDRHVARVRRPDREACAPRRARAPRALPEPLVASLAEQVEVELLASSYRGLEHPQQLRRPGSTPSRADSGPRSAARRRASRARRAARSRSNPLRLGGRSRSSELAR